MSKYVLTWTYKQLVNKRKLKNYKIAIVINLI
jgi:hypothetical protein